MPSILRSAQVALLVSIPLAGAPAHAAQAPPSPVRVLPVEQGEVADLRPVSGNVRAAQRALVAAEESGLVLELRVREGQRITKGEVLARLDSTRLELELSRARAEERLAAATLVEREVAVERARRDFRILEELARRDAGNPRELADAASDVRAAEARLAQATAEREVVAARRELLEQRLLDMQPKAPFDGVVTARHTEAGQWIDAGGGLLDLVSSGPAEIWLDVPQRHFVALREFAGSLRVTDDATGSAVEVGGWRLVPDVDPRVRTFRLIGTLPEGSSIVPGMSVRADVPSGERATHLLISPDAILRSETGPYVYVAAPSPQGGGQAAMLTPIEVLFHSGGRAAVRSPRLAPGALVVVEGNERLYPMAPIAPQEAQAR